VIAVDLNLLLYAHNRAAPQHEAAREWWQERMNGDAPVGLPEPVVYGFLRITTQRGILAEPLPTARALSILRGWLDWPRVRVLHGTAGSLARALALAEALGVAGRLTTDLQIAALAIEYRATLASADADFGRMPGLKWINPLRP
jgi:toxin-antitoxin system PIN domain toxin